MLQSEPPKNEARESVGAAPNFYGGRVRKVKCEGADFKNTFRFLLC